MISIIILTHNSQRYICDCLFSVFNQSYKDIEVVVVDNGSRDSTVDIVERNYPKATILRNITNCGASMARNQAIRCIGGQWILTLDCDVVLEPDFLSSLLGEVARNPNMAMAQGKILYPDKKTIYSCGIYLSKIRRFFDIGKGLLDDGSFESSNEIFGPCSAAALYKKELLEDIRYKDDYFDPRLFFLAEDVDLAWRANMRGWKGIFSPGSVCYHAGNSSSWPRHIRRYWCIKHRIIMILKNERYINKILLMLVSILYDLPRLLLAGTEYLQIKFNPVKNAKQ